MRASRSSADRNRGPRRTFKLKSDQSLGVLMATNKPPGDGQRNVGGKVNPREKTGNGTEQPMQESENKPEGNAPSRETHAAATIIRPAD